jgi:hypothetical protein
VPQVDFNDLTAAREGEASSVAVELEGLAPIAAVRGISIPMFSERATEVLRDGAELAWLRLVGGMMLRMARTPKLWSLSEKQYKTIVHALMELSQAVECLLAHVRGHQGMGYEVVAAVEAAQEDVGELARMPFSKLSGDIHNWFIPTHERATPAQRKKRAQKLLEGLKKARARGIKKQQPARPKGTPKLRVVKTKKEPET